MTCPFPEVQRRLAVTGGQVSQSVSQSETTSSLRNGVLVWPSQKKYAEAGDTHQSQHSRALDSELTSLAMATMMTTRLVVRNSVRCFGRRTLSSAFSARASPRTSSHRRVAIPGAPLAIRAVATDADAKTSTKTFKRHERIAAIKVRRSEQRIRFGGSIASIGPIASTLALIEGALSTLFPFRVFNLSRANLFS